MRFQKIGLTTVVLCTVGIQQSFSIDIVTKEKPNIVFILADDLGWTDLGVMGSDYYETPNIDRLATEGILFDNAYAAAANSAPSRACMMTGMYTPRHGVYTVSPPDRGDRTKRKYIAIPNVEDVCADFVTMAEALQEQGYQCGHIGKWHLGDDEDGTGPLSQGFIWNVGGNRAGAPYSYFYYNPQIQISAESETKRSIFRKRDKTKRSKKESAQHSKSRNKSFVMTSVSAL